MSQPMPPPGWYPDPSGAPGQKFWDGRRWVDHLARPMPAQKKSNGGKVALGIVVAFTLLFGGCVTLAAIGRDRSTDSVVSGNKAGIGSSVSDGQFRFRVTDVATARSMPGLEQPRGEWVVVTIMVTNTGDKAQTFFPQNQKLIDTEGREFDPDTMEAYGINNDSVMADLNPGFTVTVKVPYDVPPGTALSAIELHDSAFSGGVTVSLDES